MADPRPKPRWGEYAPEPPVVPVAVPPSPEGAADAASRASSSGDLAGSQASAKADAKASAKADIKVTTNVTTKAAAHAGAPTLRARRRWDVVLTTALLALAVYDVIVGYSTFANLAPVVQSIYDQISVGQFASSAVAAQWGLIANIARIAILAIVIVVSLLLVARRRLSFWVPLAGGALAGIIALACVMVIIASDPAYLDFVSRTAP